MSIITLLKKWVKSHQKPGVKARTEQLDRDAIEGDGVPYTGPVTCAKCHVIHEVFSPVGLPPEWERLGCYYMPDCPECR